MTVNRVTIHHEGAGSPTRSAQGPRGADGGYSIWLHSDSYVMLRPPEQNWATAGWNHRDLTVCFSGNREQYPVTDTDLAILRDAVAEARRRGWVTSTPEVVAHRHVPPSQTACPGAYVMGRWDQIVGACHGAGLPPGPPFPPFDPANGQWSLWPLSTSKPVLKVGARGDAVRYLQGVMRLKAGQQLAVDGIFGDRQTAAAVRNIQRFFGLTVDGVVGPATWKTIDFLAVK